jgi:hypothetical protein
MKGVELYGQVRRAVYVEGMGRREAARRLRSNAPIFRSSTKQRLRIVSLTFGPMSGGPGAASETARRSQLVFGPEPIGKVISVNGSAL